MVNEKFANGETVDRLAFVTNIRADDGAFNQLNA